MLNDAVPISSTCSFGRLSRTGIQRLFEGAPCTDPCGARARRRRRVGRNADARALPAVRGQGELRVPHRGCPKRLAPRAAPAAWWSERKLTAGARAPGGGDLDWCRWPAMAWRVQESGSRFPLSQRPSQKAMVDACWSSVEPSCSRYSWGRCIPGREGCSRPGLAMGRQSSAASRSVWCRRVVPFLTSITGRRRPACQCQADALSDLPTGSARTFLGCPGLRNHLRAETSHQVPAKASTTPTATGA